jgi:hypothetical protein
MNFRKEGWVENDIVCAQNTKKEKGKDVMLAAPLDHLHH